MVQTTTTYTPNYKLAQVAFDAKNWQQFMNNNLAVIDALLAKFVAVNNVQGVWQNSTNYVSGQVVIDSVLGQLYQCVAANLSAATPSTFAQERTAHPSYWVNVTIAAHGRGAWVTNTTYSNGDIVSVASKMYICTMAHTSGTFATDLAAGDWSLLIDLTAFAISWQGAYSGAVSYTINQAVSYNNASYIYTSNTPSVPGDLPTDTANWGVLAAQGATGATGATGPTGPTSIVLAKLAGANLNSTADQAFVNTGGALPAKYLILGIYATNAASSVTTAAGGVYDAASKGGNNIVPAGQAYAALTGTTSQLLPLDFASGATAKIYTAATLYFSLTTGQGSAMTADIYVIGIPLP